MAKLIRFLANGLIIGAVLIPFCYYRENKKEEVIQVQKLEQNIAKEDYLAILDIPKLEFRREIFDVLDKRNNLNDNVMVIDKSVLPSEDKPSNVIIAGHSGNGKSAFFRELYKLQVNDEVKLYYQNIIYTYIITEIEYQDKNGSLFLKSDFDDMLTLITCTKGNAKTQTIYYAELKNKEKVSKNS